VPGRGPYSANKKEKWADYIYGEDYIRNEACIECLSHVYSFPILPDGCAHISKASYDRFRSVWVLCKRNRPVVPCPEIAPLPNRKKTIEARAKICCIYLRPWTLLASQATVDVPLLTDLDLKREQWLAQNALDNHLATRKRKKMKMKVKSDEDPLGPPSFQPPSCPSNGLSSGVRAMRSSWRDYLTQVPETSARQIKNFLLASLAEGRNDAADEAGVGGARLDSVACEIDVQDVRQILAKKTKSLTAEMKETAQPDVNHARLDKATSIAAALIETQGLHTIVSKVATRTLHIASKHVRKFEAHGTETVAVDIPDVFDGTGAREQSFTRID
jgi:hypothetical protein